MTGELKTILVIDDEPDTRTFLAALFEDAGYKTVEAGNGSEGMDRVKAEKPCLVTLDVTMPETSGVRFYRNMRENDEYKDIPIVIVSGVDSNFEKFISTRRKVPAPDGYITKPVDKQKLLDTVNKLVGP